MTFRILTTLVQKRRLDTTPMTCNAPAPRIEFSLEDSNCWLNASCSESLESAIHIFSAFPLRIMSSGYDKIVFDYLIELPAVLLGVKLM